MIDRNTGTDSSVYKYRNSCLIIGIFHQYIYITIHLHLYRDELMLCRYIHMGSPTCPVSNIHLPIMLRLITLLIKSSLASLLILVQELLYDVKVELVDSLLRTPLSNHVVKWCMTQ